ncbi:MULTISPECIES: hypothetical protein [Pseudomonas]|jgi:hypothetical protein|uniref:Uncharacterized protein n=1 Tax=Pseudomonas migulae TaxID=78543 RepID=A0A1H5M078_9PSED|nr:MULTISPECIES: hypothetical protein [Pseudomonas]TWC53102.1 hypothetical protein FBY04_114137 [Pseudomonas sp. SJZ080]SEE81928.1 hypothetical protein SAMN04490194_4295 [Pseudomonas migulae]
MAISLNAAFIQPSAAQLSQSSQPLTAKTLSEDLQKTAININPAAIYHPSDETPATSLTIESIETWIGRSQSPDFPQVAERHKNAHQSLKFSFEEFQSALAHAYPDLADKKFGFTLQADGSLKALNSSGQLSSSDMNRLNNLLNASSSLKAAASSYRDASIDLVAADSVWGGSYVGGYNLNKDNFASTIDLGALFLKKGSVPNAETLNGFFSSQLWSKGERMTQATEAQMLSERNKVDVTA